MLDIGCPEVEAQAVVGGDAVGTLGRSDRRAGIVPAAVSAPAICNDWKSVSTFE
ncbi:hypothetical protein ACU4GH_18165 [Bradyrhizobium betae]